ncbi:MAG: S-methyl-5-thioribose-1-phosphate isomerase [Christensenellales bacterium]
MNQQYDLSDETVALDAEKNALVIIDQKKLPHRREILVLHTPEEIHAAIRSLQVRGAPAIGVASAIGLYVSANAIETNDYTIFYRSFLKIKEYLATARPTAVNLCWALDRMEKVVAQNSTQSVAEIKKLLRQEAEEIRAEDIRASRSMGEYGLTLIRDGDGILTYCNAGQFAAVKYGTALAPVYIGKEKGYKNHVFACETRPLLQGIRLTAYELCAHGIDVTVICDNMASEVMRQKKVQAVFVGCDHAAANGDCCNKIGTSGLAIIAKYHHIPFYVCAPASTINLQIKSGADIVIEQRAPEEITEMWYCSKMAPQGVNVYNPAFDITPFALVTAIVTDYGIVYPPYKENLVKIIVKGQTSKEG